MQTEGVAGCHRETPLMPESRTERIAFAVGLAAILGLAIALIPAFSRYNSSPAKAAQVAGGASGSSQQTAYRPPAKPKPARPVVPATPAHPSKPAAAAKKPPASVRTKVTLAAARGDCWLEVRSNTSNGKTLYVGTLPKGKSVNVSAKVVWIRLGAPQNVDVKVNGDAASIPADSLNVVVSRSGIRAAPA